MYCTYTVTTGVRLPVVIPLLVYYMFGGILETYNSFTTKFISKTVVSFKDTTKHIINQEWYNNRKTDTSSDSVRTVQTAAQLVATQIRNLEGNMNEYPTTNEMLVGGENFVPPLLHVFLSTLIKCGKKQTAIAQSIVRAARPQSILTPLQHGLAVSLHHEFRSVFAVAVVKVWFLCQL